MAIPSSAGAAATLAGGCGQVVLVGAGKMGGAILRGWLRHGLDPARIVVFEPEPSAEVRALLADPARLNPRGELGQVALIMLAVKPQIASGVLSELSPLVSPDTVVVSIMAGRTLKGIERHLPAGTAVVRAMPNLAAAIGRGMTVALANAAVSERGRELANQFLAAIGAVEWIEQEQWFDAVTAVCGSGPAYVFLLTEALASAATAAGLAPELAGRLARATVAGAGQLLEALPLAPDVLRQNVTSPGGTTAAALKILMGPNGLAALMHSAVDAAVRRSRELAQ